MKGSQDQRSAKKFKRHGKGQQKPVVFLSEQQYAQVGRGILVKNPAFRSVIRREELWGVTAYFNPAGFRNKLSHLEMFSGHVRAQGLKLMIVELLKPKELHVVPRNLADRVIRVRSDCVVWHKERLLNLGIRLLPKTCEKIVWLDGDILFQNHEWVSGTMRLLDEYAVVQPFQMAYWLPPGIQHIDSNSVNVCPPGMRSTAYDRTIYPGNGLFSGHMGFAWAARRAALVATDGLYDRFIIGGGDLVIAGAMYGVADTPQGRRWLTENCTHAQAVDVLHWSRAFYHAVKGSVSYVPGAVFHLWHGSRSDRKYGARYRVLKDNDFDPMADLKLDSNDCWMWNSDKPGLHLGVASYFNDRHEESASRQS